MQGRVVVVTGGFGALGACVAEAAAARGARVAVIDHAPQPHGSVPKDCFARGGVDLTDVAQAESAIAAVQAELGGVDALLNIAGGFEWRTIEGDQSDTWAQLFRMNLTTALNATRAALPALLDSEAGRVVNVGADAAVKAGLGMGPYAASKAAVHRLTEALAEELKDRGVTVNAVLPSILDTPRNRADMPDADPARWVAPLALAEVMLFLASPEASAVTGALVPVRGRV